MVERRRSMRALDCRFRCFPALLSLRVGPRRSATPPLSQRLACVWVLSGSRPSPREAGRSHLTSFSALSVYSTLLPARRPGRICQDADGALAVEGSRGRRGHGGRGRRRRQTHWRQLRRRGQDGRAAAGAVHRRLERLRHEPAMSAWEAALGGGPCELPPATSPCAPPPLAPVPHASAGVTAGSACTCRAQQAAGDAAPPLASAAAAGLGMKGETFWIR